MTPFSNHRALQLFQTNQQEGLFNGAKSVRSLCCRAIRVFCAPWKRPVPLLVFSACLCDIDSLFLKRSTCFDAFALSFKHLSTMSSSRPVPKACLVKELQRTVSFVVWNHVAKKGKEKKTSLHSKHFDSCHGEKDKEGKPVPDSISFVEQMVHALDVFEHVVEADSAPVFQRLTDSPNKPVRFRIKECLVPGAEGPVCIGAGPTADVRLEHLEMTNLSGENNTHISGRNVEKQANEAKAVLRKVEAVAKTILKDGKLPSGTDTKEECLKVLGDHLVQLKAAGQCTELDAEEKENNTAGPTETLTQGVAAARNVEQKAVKAEWANKMFPVSGWVCIALFHKMGIAHDECEDKLPFLKDKDCGKEEKHNHSRAAARKEEAASVARRNGHLLAQFDTKETLVANMMLMLGNNQELDALSEDVASKQLALRLVNEDMATVKWRIARCEKTNHDRSDIDFLWRQFGVMQEERTATRKELEALLEDQSRKRKEVLAENEKQKKLAKLIATPRASASDQTAPVSIATSAVDVPSVIDVDETGVSCATGHTRNTPAVCLLETPKEGFDMAPPNAKDMLPKLAADVVDSPTVDPTAFDPTADDWKPPAV